MLRQTAIILQYFMELSFAYPDMFRNAFLHILHSAGSFSFSVAAADVAAADAVVGGK